VGTVIFLDIDGVLNNPGNFVEKKAIIDPLCVNRLNIIMSITNAKIVVSSSWRYMVYGGAMTTLGFGYLLSSHGIPKILDITPKDEEVAGRGNQCLAWLSKHPEVTNHVAIDDDDIGMIMPNLNFYKTDGSKGLTDADIKEICNLLRIND